MNARRNETPARASTPLRMHDILYVLFRHRWKIILISLMGIGGGAAFYLFSKQVYESEVELLVKYVVDTRSLAVEGPDATVRSPSGSGGDSVLNSEIGIITSLDLAQEVARTVGPTNILPEINPKQDPLVAAGFAVQRGLLVGVLPKSSILQIKFQHPDPGVTRAVLTNLIGSYLRMHNRIHRSLDVLADLQRERDQRGLAIREAGEELRKIKNELQVASVDDAKRAYREEINRTRSEIFATETQLAEKRTAYALVSARLGKPAQVPDSPEATNTVAVPSVVVPPAKIAEYRILRGRIEELSRREQSLLLEYTDVSPFVQAVRQRLVAMESSRAEMEAEYPALASGELLPQRVADAGGAAVPQDRIPIQTIEIPALEARLKALNAQLSFLRGEALKLDEKEGRVEELTRNKEVEEKRFVQLETAIGQANVDQQITQGRSANIRVIQEATPALPAKTKVARIAGGMAGGGVFLALALAFSLEFYVDRSLRRRVQVEEGLRVPLFISIPRLSMRKPKARRELPAPATGTSGAKDATVGNGQPIQDLRPTGEFAEYVDSIRDRLIVHFEANGVDHKPKLVGLTSCGTGAGVTTLATALAASLSETGDGNVLYIDMNPSRGPSIHPFRRGVPNVGLAQLIEGDAEGRAAARVQDNLYVVSISEPGAKRVGVVPKTLAGLLPKIKASDYDYIIFDFPPISQTSVTSKVAGVLDMTFMVLDSEYTQMDTAKQAIDLLGEGRAKVAAVLNKHRRYLPQRLDPDL